VRIGASESKTEPQPSICYRDRKGVLQKTSTWFLKYQVGGKRVVIPTGTQDYEEAVLMLRRKMAQADPLHRSDEPHPVLIDQLLNLVIEDYRSKCRQTTYDVEHRVAKHLRPFFGTKRPFEITLTLLDQYVGSRADKAAPATVNKELAYLRRAFRLGYRHEPQLVEASYYPQAADWQKAGFSSTMAGCWSSAICRFVGL
jgi:hypothetical protein